MGLDLAGLKTNLKAVFDNTHTEGYTETEFVNDMATAIDTYVRSAAIVYTSGLTSATGGVVTGTFIGELD
jgi:hypothetical protein